MKKGTLFSLFILTLVSLTSCNASDRTETKPSDNETVVDSKDIQNLYIMYKDFGSSSYDVFLNSIYKEGKWIYLEENIVYAMHISKPNSSYLLEMCDSKYGQAFATRSDNYSNDELVSSYYKDGTNIKTYTMSKFIDSKTETFVDNNITVENTYKLVDNKYIDYQKIITTCIDANAYQIENYLFDQKKNKFKLNSFDLIYTAKENHLVTKFVDGQKHVTIHTFDSSNKMVSSYEYIQDETTQTYSPYKRIEFSYDSNTAYINEYEYLLDEYQLVKKTQKTPYLKTDENDDVVEFVTYTQSFDDNNRIETEYEYNSSNELATVTTLTYNLATGRLSEKIVDDIVNGKTKEVYYYTDNGETLIKKYKFDDIGKTWIEQ